MEKGRNGRSLSIRLWLWNNGHHNCYFHKTSDIRKKKHQNFVVKMKERTQTSVLHFGLIKISIF